MFAHPCAIFGHFDRTEAAFTLGVLEDDFESEKNMLYSDSFRPGIVVVLVLFFQQKWIILLPIYTQLCPITTFIDILLSVVFGQIQE